MVEEARKLAVEELRRLWNLEHEVKFATLKPRVLRVLFPSMTWLDKAKKWLNHRAICYRAAFSGQPGEVVLKDLAKFCRATESTAHSNPHVAARLDGRREVWLRISSHLNLTDEQLWELFGGNKPQ